MSKKDDKLITQENINSQEEAKASSSLPDLENLEKISQEETEPKKEKRGRKKKEPEQSPEEKQLIAFSKDLFSLMWTSVYDGLSKKYGEHWRIKENEAVILGEASERVLNRYLPDILKTHQELALLVLALVNISLPRVVMSKMNTEITPVSDEEKQGFDPR